MQKQFSEPKLAYTALTEPVEGKEEGITNALTVREGAVGSTKRACSVRRKQVWLGATRSTGESLLGLVAGTGGIVTIVFKGNADPEVRI